MTEAERTTHWLLPAPEARMARKSRRKPLINAEHYSFVRAREDGFYPVETERIGFNGPDERKKFPLMVKNWVDGVMC